MDNNATVITDVPVTCQIPHHRLSWAAIFAGAFTGLGLGFLLQLFGIAINLSAYHAGSAGAETIAIGGFLGLLVGVLASMGVAGYVSGYLGKFHCTHHHAGAIYGFATWSLALLLAAVLMMPLSHYVNAWNHILAPQAAASEIMPAPHHEAAMDTGTEKKPANKAETPLSKVTPTTLTGSSWMLFILFFLGAFASCVGGCIGVGCRKACKHHA